MTPTKSCAFLTFLFDVTFVPPISVLMWSSHKCVLSSHLTVDTRFEYVWSLSLLIFLSSMLKKTVYGCDKKGFLLISCSFSFMQIRFCCCFLRFRWIRHNIRCLMLQWQEKGENHYYLFANKKLYDEKRDNLKGSYWFSLKENSRCGLNKHKKVTQQ